MFLWRNKQNYPLSQNSLLICSMVSTLFAIPSASFGRIFSMVKPHCTNFWIITVILSVVRFVFIFMVYYIPLLPNPFSLVSSSSVHLYSSQGPTTMGHSCIWNEPPYDKTNKMDVHPVKTEINLGIHPVWSESSLSAWRNIESLATDWVHSEDSDQTGWMPRLIQVFTGRKVILLVLLWGSSNVHVSCHEKRSFWFCVILQTIMHNHCQYGQRNVL